MGFFFKILSVILKNMIALIALIAYETTLAVLAVKATSSAEPAQAFGKAASSYSKH